MYEKFIKSTNQVFFVVQCFLSYRVTFLCNGFAKLIIHQKALYDILYEKTCKVVFLKCLLWISEYFWHQCFEPRHWKA